jgi:hypothetical protein
MARTTQEVDETVTRTGNTVHKNTRVNDGTVENEHAANVADRVIWTIAGIILILLAFRFVLSLLGANRDAGFAQFIYGLSYPLVAPFFGLFRYDTASFAGNSTFEVYTLFAMAVYAVLAWIISRIINLNRA